MAAITTDFGYGGANLVPEGTGGAPTLAQALRDVADDFTNRNTQMDALLAKLDADAGVTDVDYAATIVAATQLTTKA